MAIRGGPVNQTSLCATECVAQTQNDCLSDQCVMTDNCGTIQITVDLGH
jgi:hypothetical protein